jgi:hypothetical protein
MTSAVPASGDPSFALITGCPRSGTTAVLEWLGQQDRVAAHEESRILHAAERFLGEVERFATLSAAADSALSVLRTAVISYARRGAAGDARLIVEKEPLESIAIPDGAYSDWLRRVRSILPALRVIFLLRDPLATVSSMRARTWGHSLSSGQVRDLGLDECIATWRANARLAVELQPDPLVMRCSYDRLVSDPATVSEDLCAFLGLRASPFRPSPARPLILSDEERWRVLEQTTAERALLKASWPDGHWQP